jgi:four helix bundle protein
MQDFRQLEVWQRAHQLVLAVYQASASLPASENFGLQLNLRRSVLNMAKTIAEGAAKASDGEFLADLRRATAAASELDYLLLVCFDLELLDEPVYQRLAKETIEVRKMISGLARRLN